MATRGGPLPRRGRGQRVVRLKRFASGRGTRHRSVRHVQHGRRRKIDKTKTKALSAGSMTIMQPGTTHFAWTGEETIVQLHGTGPWGVNYVNPADDPGKQ